MTTKNSSKKRVGKQTTKGEDKRCKHCEIQQHEETISKEELEQRGGGIIDETKAYLSLLLRCFYEGHIICCQIKTIRNLAQFIYNQKTLYTHKNGGYKLLEISSIITELNVMSLLIQEELKKEKEQTGKSLKRHQIKHL